MVNIAFSIRRSDPIQVSHSPTGRFAGALTATAYGTLISDQAEVYRGAFGAHSDPELRLVSMLRRHIDAGYPVFWEIGDLEGMNDDASNNAAITGADWLARARQLRDRFPPEAPAFGRIKYHPGEEPLLAFALYLGAPLLRDALDLLMEARRLSDSVFVVTMSVEGPKNPDVDLPLPTLEDFANGASLYGVDVSWRLMSTGTMNATG